MINRILIYCIITLLTFTLIFAGTATSVSAFDWGEWLEDDDERDLNDAMTFDEMALVFANDRFTLKINGDNGVFCLRDKKNDVIWRSNPEDWKDETKVQGSAKESINSQLIIKCYSKSQRQFITLNSYTHSCVEGGFSYEKLSDGFCATYNFPKHGITVKLNISVTDDGIVSSLKKDGFKDTDDYRVFEISTLPYFMSAGLEDSGYIFVPDGSGAVISLNKEYTDSETYYSKIYGNSYSAVNDPKDNVKALLPVYALTKNECSVMAVIEDGDALTSVYAAVSGQVNSENTVYSTYTLRDYAFYSAGAYGSTDFDVFEKGDIKQNEYKTVYTFFDKGLNDYSYIARAFSNKYLKTSEKIDYKAVIDVLAATRKVKSFIGIPVTQTEVMTNAEELSAMLDSFNQKGYDSLAIRYNSASRSELKNNIYSTLKLDRKVASAKELEEVAKSEKSRNNKLYISYNPVKFVKGLFTSSKNISRDLLGQYIYIKTHRPSGVINDTVKTQVLVKPSYFTKMTEELIKSVKGKNYGLAPLNITSDIYTDYSKDSGNSVYSMEQFKKGLIGINSQNGVLADRAGFFALASCEVNVNIPTSSSEFDLFDCSVPFYEIALSGKIPYSYESVNYSADIDSAFLKCIETGALPKYSLYMRDKSLLRDSVNTEWYSGNFEDWSNIVFAQLADWYAYSEKIGNGEITSHKKLSDGVFETTFKTGLKVTVNYNDTDFSLDSVSVSAKGFITEEGTAS